VYYFCSLLDKKIFSPFTRYREMNTHHQLHPPPSSLPLAPPPPLVFLRPAPPPPIPLDQSGVRLQRSKQEKEEEKSWLMGDSRLFGFCVPAGPHCVLVGTPGLHPLSPSPPGTVDIAPGHGTRHLFDMCSGCQPGKADRRGILSGLSGSLGGGRRYKAWGRRGTLFLLGWCTGFGWVYVCDDDL
jgi:hypothetical protein